MGYTHYFRQTKACPDKAWQAIVADFRRVLALSNLPPVAFEYDKPTIPPEVNADMIWFNGHGDDGHETMVLHKCRPKREKWEDANTHGFQFCKTAEKPYDSVVTALLCIAHRHAPTVWEISSDGAAEEWEPGRMLAERATGAAYTNPIGEKRG